MLLKILLGKNKKNQLNRHNIKYFGKCQVLFFIFGYLFSSVVFHGYISPNPQNSDFLAGGSIGGAGR
jgi:hypothetical protein